MDSRQNVTDNYSNGYPVVLQKLKMRSWEIVLALVAVVCAASSQEVVLAQSQLKQTSDVKEAQVSVSSLERKAKMEENRLLRQELLSQIDTANLNITFIKNSLVSTSSRYKAELSQIDRQISQTKALITATKQALASNQSILDDIRPAAEQGALSPVQVSRQEQEVNNLKTEIEQKKQELSRLQLEKTRLIAINQSEVQAHKQKIEEQKKQIKQHRLKIKRLDREYEKLRR